MIRKLCEPLLKPLFLVMCSILPGRGYIMRQCVCIYTVKPDKYIELEKGVDRQTEGRTDGQTDRQTDR